MVTKFAKSCSGRSVMEGPIHSTNWWRHQERPVQSVVMLHGINNQWKLLQLQSAKTGRLVDVTMWSLSWRFPLVAEAMAIRYAFLLPQKLLGIQRFILEFAVAGLCEFFYWKKIEDPPRNLGYCSRYFFNCWLSSKHWILLYYQECKQGFWLIAKFCKSNV